MEEKERLAEEVGSGDDMSGARITENDVKLALKKKLNGRSDTRIYSNPRGKTLTEYGAVLEFGCGGTGAPDFLGFHQVEITPEMVGKKIAVFLAIEAKKPGGKTDKERLEQQERWLRIAAGFGAIAGFAQSAQDAQKIISEYVGGLKGDERKGSGPGRIDISGRRRERGRNSRTGV